MSYSNASSVWLLKHQSIFSTKTWQQVILANHGLFSVKPFVPALSSVISWGIQCISTGLWSPAQSCVKACRWLLLSESYNWPPNQPIKTYCAVVYFLSISFASLEHRNNGSFCSNWRRTCNKWSRPTSWIWKSWSTISRSWNAEMRKTPSPNLSRNESSPISRTLWTISRDDQRKPRISWSKLLRLVNFMSFYSIFSTETIVYSNFEAMNLVICDLELGIFNTLQKTLNP